MYDETLFRAKFFKCGERCAIHPMCHIHHLKWIAINLFHRKWTQTTSLFIIVTSRCYSHIMMWIKCAYMSFWLNDAVSIARFHFWYQWSLQESTTIIIVIIIIFHTVYELSSSNKCFHMFHIFLYVCLAYLPFSSRFCYGLFFFLFFYFMKISSKLMIPINRNLIHFIAYFSFCLLFCLRFWLFSLFFSHTLYFSSRTRNTGIRSQSFNIVTWHNGRKTALDISTIWYKWRWIYNTRRNDWYCDCHLRADG